MDLLTKEVTERFGGGHEHDLKLHFLELKTKYPILFEKVKYNPEVVIGLLGQGLVFQKPELFRYPCTYDKKGNVLYITGVNGEICGFKTVEIGAYDSIVVSGMVYRAPAYEYKEELHPLKILERVGMISPDNFIIEMAIAAKNSGLYPITDFDFTTFDDYIPYPKNYYSTDNKKHFKIDIAPKTTNHYIMTEYINNPLKIRLLTDYEFFGGYYVDMKDKARALIILELLNNPNNFSGIRPTDNLYLDSGKLQPNYFLLSMRDKDKEVLDYFNALNITIPGVWPNILAVLDVCRKNRNEENDIIAREIVKLLCKKYDPNQKRDYLEDIIENSKKGKMYDSYKLLDRKATDFFYLLNTPGVVETPIEVDDTHSGVLLLAKLWFCGINYIDLPKINVKNAYDVWSTDRFIPLKTLENRFLWSFIKKYLNSVIYEKLLTFLYYDEKRCFSELMNCGIENKHNDDYKVYSFEDDGITYYPFEYMNETYDCLYFDKDGSINHYERENLPGNIKILSPLSEEDQPERDIIDGKTDYFATLKKMFEDKFDKTELHRIIYKNSKYFEIPNNASDELKLCYQELGICMDSARSVGY